MSELPNELMFSRIEDFDGYMPLNDEEWQAFWKYMCKTYKGWSESNLRSDEIDEDEE
jgi:hypothetical protein